jgi:hypothetical protein
MSRRVNISLSRRAGRCMPHPRRLDSVVRLIFLSTGLRNALTSVPTPSTVERMSMIVGRLKAVSLTASIQSETDLTIVKSSSDTSPYPSRREAHDLIGLRSVLQILL